MARRMVSPVRANLPSGTATSLPPKPRKPPVLRRMAVTLPSGAVLTLCTVPSLVPSEVKTASPTMESAFFGVMTDLSPGGGAGLVAGGGVVGPGVVGGAVCAAADISGRLIRRAATPRRLALWRLNICRLLCSLHLPVNGREAQGFQLSIR